MMVTFLIPGKPVPKQRARTARGHTFTPARTRAYEEHVAVLASLEDSFGRDSELEVTISIFSATSPRGDLDNYAKAILDALQKGGLFPDDRQVARLVVERFKRTSGDEDYVRVEVEERG